MHDVAKTHTERDTHRERHTERFSESPVALLGLRAFAAAVRFDDREERIGREKALTCSAQGMMTQRLREIQTQTQTQTRARAHTQRGALTGHNPAAAGDARRQPRVLEQIDACPEDCIRKHGATEMKRVREADMKRVREAERERETDTRREAERGRQGGDTRREKQRVEGRRYSTCRHSHSSRT